jgi:hypothetical protein
MADGPEHYAGTPILDRLLWEARNGGIRTAGRHHITPDPAPPEPDTPVTEDHQQ